ncbi:helix-turn-helix domain-containing protein [Flavobacterium aquidurense]|uniref:helix-turn-helix domain-containing protein n=1 Tax=Flavobacterium aquidurense TaxID=362413 RepID=UPI0028601869|nr:helix-turn-helix domain-containing protein [Flavobacterium aquidurense]MDR7372026.1 AraC-like DNA-binding protein/mannose-6-phosphate isomerase-like protein (cupin superfamily) [Flavobacterium aquidurense]
MRNQANEKIKTYGSKGFRDRFLGEENPMHLLFKSNSDHFFCLKVEEMMQLRYTVPPSKHSCSTLLFITSGTHIMKVGFEEYHTYANEFIVVPAGQVFSIEQINNNHRGIICQFHPDILIGKYGNREMLNDFDFLKISGTPKISIPEKETVFILNLLNRLQTEYLENEITDLNIVQSYLMALFCEMNKNAVKIPKNGTAAAILSTKFKELIHANIKSQHQVNYYASLLNVTPNHLNKSVKSATGKSATKWIEESILLESKYLLHQSTLSISDIAMQVGHEDQSYFSRFFKKHEGVTPGQYRKMIDKS